ncbi:unnamed protein product [Protopolystoma xenopodis]|uniref:Uncharacterized protein n=1 Tax=Protopolystoma xenopodis TaxID=117903 RepID=A0A3S5ASM1_9PLAT|nr:unnamed protein product [Protopolystoma xenopodis]
MTSRTGLDKTSDYVIIEESESWTLNGYTRVGVSLRAEIILSEMPRAEASLLAARPERCLGRLKKRSLNDDEFGWPGS